MRRLKIKLQYDGTAYSGWQVQPSSTTVQGLLEESLRRITGEKVNVIGAGRTDAGVHAIEQVASFDSSSRLDNAVLKRALNALLPRDVRVIDVQEAEGDFHARYSALRKRYFYLVANTEDRPVFIERYAWWIRLPLNMAEMKEAGSLLCGSHDFSSFRGAGCSARHSVREVSSLEIGRPDEMGFLFTGFNGRFIGFSIEANGFLRHMVRNIVGTLVEVGMGKTSPEKIKEILESRDRRRAGPTAPAKGLFLEKVIYRL